MLMLGISPRKGHPAFEFTTKKGWWFQIFFIFTPIWGNDPIWLIFFKWVVQPPTRKRMASIFLPRYIVSPQVSGTFPFKNPPRNPVAKKLSVCWRTFPGKSIITPITQLTADRWPFNFGFNSFKPKGHFGEFYRYLLSLPQDIWRWCVYALFCPKFLSEICRMTLKSKIHLTKKESPQWTEIFPPCPTRWAPTIVINGLITSLNDLINR